MKQTVQIGALAIGVFLALMFLFIRGLPAISIFEMREVVHHAESPVEPTHVH